MSDLIIMPMEQKFKDALRDHYKLKLTSTPSKEYVDHLFPIGWSYREAKRPIEVALKAEKLAAPAKSSTEDIEASEKTKIINSLKDFSENLLDKNDSDTIKLDKIEISKKESSLLLSSDSKYDQSLIESFTSKDSYSARYANKSNEIDVIFVADTLRSGLDLSEEASLLEFLALFDKSTAQLFSKMVKAMKLDSASYLLTAISFEDEKLEKTDILPMVLSEIEYFKPKLIISLGVSASHALIDTKQRLKDLHGNFYPIKIDSFESTVMPLFSPSLLNSAPHMKSITWIDMQKAMEKLQS